MGNPAGNNGTIDDLWMRGDTIDTVLMDDESGGGEFGYVTFHSGVVVPITSLTDAEGNDVDTWALAYEFTFGAPGYGYGSSLVSHLILDKGTVH